MPADEHDESAADRQPTIDETWANEVTPLGVTKHDQSGPRAQREAAINGSWAPGPGSGPEGSGADLGAYPGGVNPKGEGPNAPDSPTLGGQHRTARADTPQMPAGKSPRKPHGAEPVEATGPKTYGTPAAYAGDDRTSPAEHTHEGGLSFAGGSSGSGGGGEGLGEGLAEGVSRALESDPPLDETHRARPTPPYPSSVESTPDEHVPGQPVPGEPLTPGGNDTIPEPPNHVPGA